MPDPQSPPSRFIDRKSPFILAQLAAARRFRKVASVQARRVEAEETVVTRLKAGLAETTNTAKAGDWIVTNPSGEAYVLSEAQFFARYRATDVLGTYEACGFCRAIRNPFAEPIEIAPAWGGLQRGLADCLIADTCDAEGTPTGEPYLIDAQAFAETYRPVA